MRTVRITLFVCFAACSTSAVWAQYGLYGSPETLQMPKQEAAQAPASYPATATPMAGPALAQAYYPPQQPVAQPQYTYPAQPRYAYPAQPRAVAGYQPYQPGAQYRYPAPYTRAPMRTAAVEQPTMIQPMPAPPEMAAAAPTPAPMPMPMPMDAAAPQSPSMMNQMLAEQGNSGCYGGENNCNGAYRGAVGRYEQAACGSCDSACGPENYCPWYASVSALVMNRSDSRRLWTSYEDGNLPNQIMNTQFPMAWKWGGEVRFGRRFCCGCTPYALEASYWTTENFTGFRSATVNGGYVSTTLNVDYITFNDGTERPASDWFFGAEEQTLQRRNEFHNVEVNLIREQLAWAVDSPWDIGWSAGVRYFRFEEALTYSSLRQNGSWATLADSAYFSNDVTNDLVGFQFGFDAAYNLCNGLRAYITPKVGIYDNFINSTSQARLGDGTAGVSYYKDPYTLSDPTSYQPAPHGTKTSLAFLMQIDLGLDWQFSRNWSARAGYRVVAVTGMALADEQFPQYMCDIPDMQRVQNNSSLVLHGAVLGLTYNF